MKNFYIHTAFLILIAFQVKSQSQYPVMLSMPIDFDTIIETEPVLSWQTDVQGLISDPRYSQRLILCELFENQTKSESINLNQPLVVLNDYQSTVYNYSSTTDALEPGHTYTWQIQIMFNSLQVDQSSIYQFTIAEPNDTLPGFYPVHFKMEGMQYVVEQGKIGLVTDERGELNLSLKIESNGNTLPICQLKEFKDNVLLNDTISVDENENRFYFLDVDALNLDSGFYTVTWNPKQGRTFVFNFSIE